MNEILVHKKDGSLDKWNPLKIQKAIEKSAERCSQPLSSTSIQSVIGRVEKQLPSSGVVTVETVHELVIKYLLIESPKVGKVYSTYHQFRKQIVGVWGKVYSQTQNTLYFGDRENANFNSSLSSTKGSLIRGHLTKELYKQFYLTEDEVEDIEAGFIYIHDLRDLIFNGINCCLFDMATVLKGGFEMAGVKYKEPKSVLSALQVIGDVTLVATAQQFGGFTIPELDKILVPYCLKSYERYVAEANVYGVQCCDTYAMNKVIEDIKQGLQSLEMKLNTVPSSRGDTAFVTVSFANVDSSVNPFWQRLICHEILSTRMNGQGNGSPVVFPKLVYLHSEDQHENLFQQELFDHAIECSSKCMYPDYLSLDNSEVGEVFHRTGKAISMMGCRAQLSEWKDSKGESHFVGRANIGAVSLNLPMIWKESGGGDNFFKLLNKYLQMIRGFHKRRYEAIADNLCSTNPLGFTQGGFLGGFKKPEDKIGMDIVKTFTASFGITALNELNVLMEGKPLHESDQEKVIAVVDHIKDTVESFKKEDGYLYALYATPAESLAGTQLQQFRDKYGVIEGVSDSEYFSNGFHCHVTADITPFEKQDKEQALFHKINGGHIQYVRLDNPNNTKAIHDVVKRGMRMGFYQGVNFDLVVCEECGHRPKEFTKVCPQCGSTEITATSRVCGYLGVRYSKGDTRFNESKLQEVKDRRSM